MVEDYTQFYILVEGGSGGGLHTVLYIIVEQWKWWRTTHSSIYYS